MTTIVVDAKQGVMCADSHWTDGNEKGPMRKVWRINGALVGFSGNIDEVVATKAYIEGGLNGDPPKMAEALALVLDGNKAFAWTRGDGLVLVPGRYAIGTGGKAARAAMAAGATAQRALSIARDIDATTSGRIRVYKLKAGQ
jgi:ATP-dependent protease HslVU (ClpYQ) peptidase subunit